MDKFTYSEIMAVVNLLVTDKALNGIIYVAGGIVPYLYTGKESHRKHNDIDIVAHADDMLAIRTRLKALGLYVEYYDSISFAFNLKKIDHGLEVFIQDVPVNIAPFSIVGNDILQRNFLKEEIAGFDALMTATMKDIALMDYVTKLNRENGLSIGTYTIEMVKAAKERSNRDKDVHDIQTINNLGIDENRYGRVKPVMEGMQLTVETSEGMHK